MFSSLSALSSSTSASFGSMSSATTEILSTVQSQSFKEEVPLVSKEKFEKKLDSALAQVQQDQIKRLDLTAASLGRFYELAHTLNGHESIVLSLAVFENGSTFASGSGDPENAIKLWDLASGSCLFTLQGHTHWVESLATLPNGRLASGSHDTTIKLWDLASHSCLATLQGHTGSVYALTALSNGHLASGSSDKTIKLWDPASHACLFTLQGHTQWVEALAVLPNNLLASGSHDTTIKLWDLASHSCLSTLEGHISPVLALAALPNDQLASGSQDCTIKLWDLTSYSCLATLQGHTSTIWTLSVLPNGLLASGSQDCAIKLWDLTSHSCLSTLKGHAGTVWALAAFPNGQIASGSWDNTIKLWKPRAPSAKHLLSILNALENNTSVTNLDLSNNQDIGDDIIDPLINILTKPGIFFHIPSKLNTTLKTIELQSTGVSQKGVGKLKKAIQHQRLLIEVLSDCPVEWMMIYFLIIFCRANRNSPFADSGLDLCKYGDLGYFLGIPSGLFARARKDRSGTSSSKNAAFPLNSPT